MAPDMLFQRLDQEGDAVQAQILQARERAEELERRLEALTITRCTLAEIMETEPHGEKSADRSQKPHPGEKPAGPSARKRAKRTRPSVGKPQTRPLGPLSRQIVTLLATADRPLRAREVTIALGRKNPSRTQVQGVRRACNRLAENGHLLVLKSGEFTGPTGAA